jgi:hypothetical protein
MLSPSDVDELVADAAVQALGERGSLTVNRGSSFEPRKPGLPRQSGRDNFAREFDSTGEARIETLLAAAAACLKSVHDRGTDVFVLDALLPYLPSLLVWGYTDDEVAAFFARLSEFFVGFEVVEVQLVGDPSRALTRAVEREREDWLDGHLAKASGFRAVRPIATRDDLVAYYNDAAARSQALAAGAPWRVEVIDVEQGETSVLVAASAAIASLFEDG